jgi:hypothetical protein
MLHFNNQRGWWDEKGIWVREMMVPATGPVAGADADPQATALASLIGVDQTHIRAGIAFLLALILEAGSALGFAIVATATKGFPPTAAPDHPSPRKPSTTRHTDPTRLRASDDHIRRWALSGLNIDPASSVPARRTYEAFCNWARGQGNEPPTETYFGRQFTKEIAILGGRKKRTRKATLYSGIALADPVGGQHLNPRSVTAMINTPVAATRSPSWPPP